MPKPDPSTTILGKGPDIPRVETIHAFVAVDENGDEGVMATQLNGAWFPLITADERRIKMYIHLAEQIKQSTGMNYRILRFSKREDVTQETLDRYL